MLRRLLVEWLYGAFAWGTFFFVSALNIALGTLAQVVLLPFDPTRRTSLWFSRHLWGRLLFALEVGFPIERDGLENLGPGPYVMVCNHISALDIPACLGLPTRLRLVAKEELFEVPFLGWYMRLSRQIAVDRGGSPEALARTLGRCRSQLDDGVSILFFPEGTRAKEGRLLPFRRGAFRIAKDTNTPILPLAIYGSHYAVPSVQILPMRAFTPVRLRVLPPIDPAESATARGLSNRARDAIARALEDLAAEVEPRARFPNVLPVESTEPAGLAR